jgi:hypothetical protein
VDGETWYTVPGTPGFVRNANHILPVSRVC